MRQRPASNVGVRGDLSRRLALRLRLRSYATFLPSGSRFLCRPGGDLWFRFIPDKYWGIGYDNGSDPQNEEAYDRTEFRFNPTFLKRVAPGLWPGGRRPGASIRST